MKTLLVLRHAKSSWTDPALDDHDRPLNDRGRRDAPRMGRLLDECGLQPNIVLSSSARRARKTAQKVIAASRLDVPLEVLSDLYHAHPADYVEALRTQTDACDCVLIVGHNPGLEELLFQLTQQPERMPTAALAQIELDIDRWDELSVDTRGELRNLWRPKELDGGVSP